MQRSGEQKIRQVRYEEEKKLKESRSAKDDPEGHWGSAVEGYQLSLRFAKNTYSVDEPVVATVLVRNVTNSVLRFLAPNILERPSPVDIEASFKGTNLPSKKGTEMLTVVSSRELKLFPQTQFKYRVNLGVFYSLTNAGEYIFQATNLIPPIATNVPLIGISSEKVRIVVTNGNKQGVK